jgi:hypothetical protein
MGLFRDGRRYDGKLTFANGGDLLENKETRHEHLETLVLKSEEVKSDLILKEFKGVWHDERNSEGTLLYESGSIYKGQLKINKRHGKGVYTYPSIEELNQAKANNQGMITHVADTIRLSFSGEWEEDVKIRGLLIYRKGDKYEAPLFDDWPHGKGVSTLADGSVY